MRHVYVVVGLGVYGTLFFSGVRNTRESLILESEQFMCCGLN